MTTAYIDFSGHVIVVLSDGTEIDMGEAPKLPAEQVIVTTQATRGDTI